MDRARLAQKAGAELLEHAVGVHKNLQEAPHRSRIIGGMFLVLRKPDRLRQFVRHFVDGDVDAGFPKRGHDGGVETRHRLSGQRKLPLRAVAGGNAQSMIDQVEVDLKGPDAVRYRRGRQSPRGDVQRDVPGMIEPG